MSRLLIICLVLYMLYNMLNVIFTSLPFRSLCSCFGYLFCDDRLLVGADGKHVEGGPDGNNGAA